MSYITLIDAKNSNTISIDSLSNSVRIEIDEIAQEIRVKPFMASILYALFSKHPNPLLYDDIIQILKNHNLIISDLTRMHRKLSEIRNCIQKLHPGLNNFITNTRGIGYTLPLSFKNIDYFKPNNQVKFSSSKINKLVLEIEALINDSILIASKGRIIKNSIGYIIDQEHLKNDIMNNIAIYNRLIQNLLKELRLHEAEFLYIRIEYYLNKLKTYIGIARVSEFPISELEWKEWFKQEAVLLFAEIKKYIKYTENI